MASSLLMAKAQPSILNCKGLNMAYEIERKFLVEKLSEEELLSRQSKVKEIEQCYLLPSEEFPVRRARKVTVGKHSKYFYTLKRDVKGTFVREEIEEEICENRYLEILKERDFTLNSIVKTRYVIEENGLQFELDRFPFFTRFDVLEVELSNENEQFEMPKYFKVIKEVTTDYRFTNVNLAREIPKDI